MFKRIIIIILNFFTFQKIYLKIWDLAVNRTWSSIACRQTMLGHGNFVRCLQVFIQQFYLNATFYLDYLAIILPLNFILFERYFFKVIISLQMDDHELISGSYDCKLKKWSLATGQCLSTLKYVYSWVTSTFR